MKIALGHTSITLAVAVALAACGSGGAGSPAAGTAAFAPAAQAGDDATKPNVSGEYAGTIKDNKEGKGPASASVAQYAATVGGPFVIGKGTYSLTAAIAFAMSSGNKFSGTLVTPGTTVCSFATSGGYKAATHLLSGSYHSINGCSGEHGTFTMKQKCFFARPGADADVGGLKMC